MSDSSWPYGLQPTRLLCPWDSLGKNTRVGYCALLQGIFPTQGLNHISSCFLHWQVGSLPLELLGWFTQRMNIFLVVVSYLEDYEQHNSNTFHTRYKFNSYLSIYSCVQPLCYHRGTVIINVCPLLIQENWAFEILSHYMEVPASLKARSPNS